MIRALTIAAAMAAPVVAHANCESIANRASSVSGDQVAATYGSLIGCDAKLAADSFGNFMRASGDVGSLVGLSLVAIEGGVSTPVFGMLEEIPDMSLRDEVAKGLGAECAQNEKVVGFLKSAYTSLRDRQFGMWREAYLSCESEDLDAWLGSVVETPPPVSYDEKYNVVTEALVKRVRAEALPTLGVAARAAAGNGGPFTTLVDRMNDAARPATFGAEMSDEDRAALEAALVEVARGVAPEQALMVADRLYQAGAESAAVSLLPSIYADRVQGKGRLMYGVAAIESCDGEAVVHFAEVIEAGKRWSILNDVTPLALAFKPKLKCAAEGEWPVLTTPEPVASRSGISEWLETVSSQYAGQGVDVKTKEEKAIALD